MLLDVIVYIKLFRKSNIHVQKSRFYISYYMDYRDIFPGHTKRRVKLNQVSRLEVSVKQFSLF